MAKSYQRLYRKLPAEVLELLAAEYDPVELDRILAGFMCERPVTLRVNRLRTDVRQVMESLRREGVKFERVLWYEDALVVKDIREKEFEGLELYLNGHIYLQSLSSMIPPLVLQPAPGAKILDLTAAPGSKTTQRISGKVRGQNEVLASDSKSFLCPLHSATGRGLLSGYNPGYLPAWPYRHPGADKGFVQDGLGPDTAGGRQQADKFTQYQTGEVVDLPAHTL